MRIGGALAKGYLFEEFREVFRRYIPRAEVEALRAQVKDNLEAQAAAPGPLPAAPGKAEVALEQMQNGTPSS